MNIDKPKIVAIVGDVDEGKSMLLYNILENLSNDYTFNLFYYGLRVNIAGTEIFSVRELETIRDSLIVIDELSSLFDLDDRKAKRSIENTLRLVCHNNNIIILCGTPENYKKFIAAKANEVIFKKCTIADFINGSMIKNIVMEYKGNEMGSEVLNIPKNKALRYDGTHFNMIDVRYIDTCDTKKANVNIFTTKE